MNTFTARYSVWRLTLLLFACSAFVVCGLWMAGFFGPPPSLRGGLNAVWVGWTAIILFGSCFVAIFVQIFDRNDQIRISTLGIYSKKWSNQIIPWSEIHTISVWENHRNRTIILHLHDIESFPSTTMFRFLSWTNPAITGGDIAINFTGTDKSFDEGMSAIQFFMGKHPTMTVGRDPPQ